MDKRAEILRKAFSYQNSLTAYAYVILQDWSLAEDVVQDLFVTLSTKWESFDQNRELKPWLRRIVRNRSTDIIRKRGREMSCGDEEIMDLIDQSFGEADNEDFRQLQKTRHRFLRDCISKLSVDSRELLFTFYNERRSCAEIAAEQGRSENAVYISLTRTRQKLRKCVREKMSRWEGA